MSRKDFRELVLVGIVAGIVANAVYALMISRGVAPELRFLGPMWGVASVLVVSGIYFGRR